MAANPEGSGDPKGWNPRRSAGATSMPHARTLDPTSILVRIFSFGTSTRTLTSKAALSSRPLHMSAAYHSAALPAWANTEATVKSRPGTGAPQSSPRAGSSSTRHCSAADSTSSPVTGAHPTQTGKVERPRSAERPLHRVLHRGSADGQTERGQSPKRSTARVLRRLVLAAFIRVAAARPSRLDDRFKRGPQVKHPSRSCGTSRGGHLDSR